MRTVSIAVLLCVMSLVASAQTPIIRDGGIVNGATFDAGEPVTPGSLISIFGSALATKLAQADSIPIATQLAGVSVNFITPTGTFPGPITFALPDNPGSGTPAQLNVQVPWEAMPAGASGTATVVVVRDGVSSTPATVSIGPFSPGIFSSGGRAVAVNLDGTLAWPAGVIAGLTTHPAKPGDVLILYATGLGAVDVPVQSGHDSQDALRQTLTKPIVLMGGISAPVQFSGMSPQFVGVNQLNVVVPNTAPGDAVPIQLQVGGITTSDQITLAITR